MLLFFIVFTLLGVIRVSSEMENGDTDRVKGSRNAPSQTQSGSNKFIYSLTVEAKRVALFEPASCKTVATRKERNAL